MASFIETYGGNLAAGTSGMGALQRALDAGLTINQIRNQAAQEGVKFGPKASDFLTSRPSNTFISKYGGNENTMASSGLNAVLRAQQAGMSLDEIQDQAQKEGINWGIRAQELFSSYNTQQEFALQQQNFQQQIQQQQALQQQQFQEQQAKFQQQLAEQQKQAQEAQRQLMINMQRGDRAPAAVKTASSGAEKTGLTRRGTTGYFGRSGMRIGSLNVPSTGLAITPNVQMPTSGSFA